MKEKLKNFFSGEYTRYIQFPEINWKFFLVVMAVGFVMHSFRITQMINGADDVSLLMKGYGGGTTFGRWGLDFLGFRVNYKWLIGSFNLSVFDGMLTLVFLSLSACIILNLFHLQQSRIGLLFAVIFVVYPTCSATLLYMFTAAYYGFGCFLAVLSVWCMKTGKKLYGCLAILCIAFSLGLYQAYFPITVTLCLFLVLDYFMDLDADLRVGLRKGFYYVFIMCLGLGLYFIILDNRLKNLGAELNTYQNISSMGQIQLDELPGLFMRCYSIFFGFPSEIYLSVNTLAVIRSCLLVLYVLCAILGICAVRRQRKWLSRIMAVLLMTLVPVAVNLIEIMCSKSHIHVLMVYSTVFVFLLPVLFWKKIKKEHGISGLLFKVSGIVIAISFIITALGYGWHANWNYVALDYMNRETESYMTTLVTRIKSAKGYKDEYPVMFVGERGFSDQQFINPYSNYPELYFIIYQEINLINAFSWRDAMTAYTGFTCTAPSEQQWMEICGTKEFQEMSCYPNDGSIAVIDEVIVVKIAEQ